ncbi:RHS repeat domain-containing protein [Micromonospora sp. DT233]|uniref:RHS repeat domain-containing protein n=1 Tax=Micromonospora sp. DT233 TaxID=3393432 RepID=UPI003CF0463D
MHGLVVAMAMVLTVTSGAFVPERAAAATVFKSEEAQRYRSVDGRPVPATRPAADPAEAAAKVKRPPPVWPAAAAAEADLTAIPARLPAGAKARVRPGELPVRVDAPARGGKPGRVKVQVLSQAAAAAAGVRGVLYRVSRTDGATDGAAVRFSADFSGFRSAYGADWAARLRLSVLPECALEQPSSAACTSVPLSSSLDSGAGTVTADVPLASAPDGTAERIAARPQTSALVALAAGAAGGSGDLAASSLSPSATWGHTGSSGGFTWAYPMRVPPSVGGPAPQLAFAYSSQAVDGRHAASNNQPGWIGEGFSYEPGFIERSYKSCADDMDGNANNSTETWDRCWGTENAVISLNGSANELLKGADGRWHPVREDGSRVELLKNAAFGNGDDDNEYWRVTTADGTKYWFGRHRLPGWATDMPETNSVLSAPVAGNNAGEPCHENSFADSFCDQAWRWNLDYIEDRFGNTTSLWYKRETNYYAQNQKRDEPVAYHRGGYPTRIDYGTNNRSGTDSVFATTATPAQVHFQVADRCLSNCATKDATTWPDTPWDHECTENSTNCQIGSPTFWSSKRLTAVTTKVWRADLGRHQDVDQWNLRQTFPDPGDTTRAGLWLAGITHKGLNGTAISLPEVTFAGIQMPNRVDASGADWAPAMNWWRVGSIRSESGGEISVSYSGRECVKGSVMPSAAENNKLRCYPVRWTPQGRTDDITDYFHKYVVTQVQQIDHTGGAPASKIFYSYENPSNLPLWHYDSDDGLIDPKRKTWSQWRGYPYVVTKVGEGPKQQVTRTLYFRGMHGDKTSTGTRNVSVAGMEGGSVADLEQYAGIPREQVGYLDGEVLAGVVSTPWRSTTPTATRTINDSTVEARYVAVEKRETRTLLDGESWRRSATVTEYAQDAAPLKIKNLGDPADPNDDRCLSHEYLSNTNADVWVLRSSKRVRSWSGDCTAGPTSAAQVTSDMRFSYDQLAHGTVPTKGLVSKVERMASWNGGNPTFQVVGTYQHDAQGRTVESTDVAGRVSKSAFTPAAGGPLTSVTTTNNANWTSTVTLDPAWGVVTRESDVNSRITGVTYDALGRRTSVRLPDRPVATNPTPNAEFDYVISKTAPNAVTTKVINANGDQLTRYELFDGLLRPRQTQTPAVGGGRTITDTFYNSAGAVWKSNAAHYNQSTPGTTLFLGYDLDMPTQTRYEYDSAGRVTDTIFYSENVEKWRTKVAYHGDRVDTTPPEGGTATTVYTDLEGRATRLLEYHGATPSGTADETRYRYHQNGQLEEVQDASRNKWTFEYDELGRLKRTVDPDRGATSRTYTSADQLETVRDEARGITLAHTYEPLLGRPSTVRDGSATGAKRVEWTYDLPAKGLTKSVSRWMGTDEYKSELVTADALYRPTQTKATIPAVEGLLAGSYAFRTSYKPDGSTNTVTMPAAGNLTSETVTYGYDTTLGLPKSLATNYGDATHYVIDAGYTNFGESSYINRSTALTGSTVLQSKREYDEATRRVERTAVLRSTGSSYVSDTQYEYDHAGNLVKVDDNPLNGQRDTQCFEYDHLRRLTQAWTPASSDCATAPESTPMGGAAPYWQSWDFGAPTDPAGRTGSRLKEVDHLTPSGVLTTEYANRQQGQPAVKPHLVDGYTVKNATGQVVKTGAYTYDEAGNTKTRPGPNGQQTLSWDAEGHLASVSDSKGTTSYVYDGLGSRLLAKSSNGTKTLYLGGMQLELSGTVVSATRYYNFNGEIVAQRTGAGVKWLCSDLQGTAQVAVSADAAQTVTRRRQTPFGEERGSPPTWVNTKGFVGGDVDPSGLVHLGAREYDPNLGRFISVDPIIDFSNPQQMHGYAYANNNPITFSDPSGLFWGDCKTFLCGVMDGIFDALNLLAMLQGIWKLINNLGGAYKAVKGEAEKWEEKTGSEVLGWTCALSGICDMLDSCAMTPDPYACGKVIGGALVDLLITALTAGAGGVAAMAKNGVKRAHELSKKLGIPDPHAKTDVTPDSPSGDRSPTDAPDSDGGPTPTPDPAPAPGGGKKPAPKGDDDSRGKKPGKNKPAVTSGGRKDGGKVVAGHGWYFSSNGYTPPLSSGTYLHFYVQHGEKILDVDGLRVEGGARSMKPAETFGPGDQVPNYTIGQPNGLNILTGSIVVQGDRLLGDMLADGTISGVCHMAVCREVFF